MPRRRACCVIDKARLDGINLVSEAITVATLAPFDVVAPKDLAATVKIIPFAVPRLDLERCIAIAREGGPLIRIAGFRSRPVALIQTRLPGLKESVLDKTLEIMNGRLASLGAGPATEVRCGHTVEAVTQAIADAKSAGAEMILIAGASAIADRRDVIPDGDRAGRRHHRAFRHARGSRKSAAAGPDRRGGRHGTAGLRAFAEAQRLRLGLAAAHGGFAGEPQRYHGAGRRRPAEGNPVAAAAPRRRTARQRRHPAVRASRRW